MSLHQPILARNRLPGADPLEVFKERCWARALLVSEGLADLQESVDTLQNFAVAFALVPNDRAQDEIQLIMADAFGRIRRWP